MWVGVRPQTGGGSHEPSGPSPKTADQNVPQTEAQNFDFFEPPGCPPVANIDVSSEDFLFTKTETEKCPIDKNATKHAAQENDE